MQRPGHHLARTLENNGRPLECFRQESDISGLCFKRINRLL